MNCSHKLNFRIRRQIRSGLLGTDGLGWALPSPVRSTSPLRRGWDDFVASIGAETYGICVAQPGDDDLYVMAEDGPCTTLQGCKLDAKSQLALRGPHTVRRDSPLRASRATR